MHLSRDLTTKVSLVSPLPFTNFSDLIYRAKTNDNAQSFIDYQVNTSSEIKNLFDNYVNNLGFSKEKDIPKRYKTIVNRLKQFIEKLNYEYDFVLLPFGDGVGLVRK